MSVLVRIVIKIGVFLSNLVSFKLINVVYEIKCVIYSKIIERSLKVCGDGFKIGFPCVFYGVEDIEIGNNFNSFARLRLEAFRKHNGFHFRPNIRIGDNVSINYDCHIGCINKIIIEDNVLIASKVFITDHFHGEIDKKALLIPPSKRMLVSKGPVIIKKNVWIGEGVVIMPNVTIGENSIIGANSVVTKDIPANCVVAGIPARIIKNIN